VEEVRAEPLKVDPLNCDVIRGALVLDNDSPAIDWDSMIFSYQKTNRMYISHCKQDGGWGPGMMQDFSSGPVATRRGASSSHLINQFSVGLR